MTVTLTKLGGGKPATKTCDTEDSRSVKEFNAEFQAIIANGGLVVNDEGVKVTEFDPRDETMTNLTAVGRLVGG